MYLQSETIREENDEDSNDETEGSKGKEKDAAYYKRKKFMKRKKYNKLSKLIIEDNTIPSSSRSLSSPNQPSIDRFEGTLVDLSLESETGSAFHGDNPTSLKTTSGNEKKDMDIFRYALLEVVAGSDGRPTEVNVIPVHHMFAFRRPSLAIDKLLDEIDDDYDDKIRRDKLKLQKYRRIGNALEDLESRGEASRLGSEGSRDETGTGINGSAGGFQIPSLFGNAAKKAKMSRGRKKGDSNMSGLVDDDQARDFDSRNYSAKFVDDEEDDVVSEQIDLNATEDRFIADRETVDKAWRMMTMKKRRERLTSHSLLPFR
jgi:hypothetical protein